MKTQLAALIAFLVLSAALPVFAADPRLRHHVSNAQAGQEHGQSHHQNQSRRNRHRRAGVGTGAGQVKKGYWQQPVDLVSH